MGVLPFRQGGKKPWICRKELKYYRTYNLQLELRIYGNEMGVLPLRQGVKETMDLP